MQHSLHNPASDMLDVAGLSILLGLSPATVLTLRARAPDRVPPPWRTRPLRWRREAVMRWLADQENREQRRIEELMRPVSRPRVVAGR